MRSSSAGSALSGPERGLAPASDGKVGSPSLIVVGSNVMFGEQLCSLRTSTYRVSMKINSASGFALSVPVYPFAGK
jgi:hypothetical protein